MRLQRDLRMALTEGIDRAIFKGDSGPAGTGADIVGLQTAAISESRLPRPTSSRAIRFWKCSLATLTANTPSPGDVRIVTSVGSNVLWMTRLKRLRSRIRLSLSSYGQAVSLGPLGAASTPTRQTAILAPMSGLQGEALALRLLRCGKFQSH